MTRELGQPNAAGPIGRRLAAFFGQGREIATATWELGGLVRPPRWATAAGLATRQKGHVGGDKGLAFTLTRASGTCST